MAHFGFYLFCGICFSTTCAVFLLDLDVLQLQIAAVCEIIRIRIIFNFWFFCSNRKTYFRQQIAYVIYFAFSYNINIRLLSKRFRDPIRVPGIENRAPRIRENYQGKYLWNL